MITHICPSQLSFLLQIPKTDAEAIIIHAANKENHKAFNEEGVPVSLIEKARNIPLQMALEDLYQNALKRNAFRGYLIQYPLAKMKPSKKTGSFPRTIRLPSALRSLLSKETLLELAEIWSNRYKNGEAKNTVFFP